MQLSQAEQDFTIYYKLYTEKNGFYWIGYRSGSSGTINARENTQLLEIGSRTSINYCENIFSVFKRRFPNIDEKPYVIECVRVRASDRIPTKIIFNFEFVDSQEIIGEEWKKGATVNLTDGKSNQSLLLNQDHNIGDSNNKFDIIAGKWSLTIKNPKGIVTGEEAEIKSDGKYFIPKSNNPYRFNLELIEYKPDEKKIIFNKKGVSSNKIHSQEVLTIKNTALLEGYGHNNEEHRLTYLRIK